MTGVEIAGPEKIGQAVITGQAWGDWEWGQRGLQLLCPGAEALGCCDCESSSASLPDLADPDHLKDGYRCKSCLLDIVLFGADYGGLVCSPADDLVAITD